MAKKRSVAEESKTLQSKLADAGFKVPQTGRMSCLTPNVTAMPKERKSADVTLLESAGWQVECESPLEIRRGQDFAAGGAARIVLETLKLDGSDNLRRMHLLDKRLYASLTIEETQELDVLQVKCGAKIGESLKSKNEELHKLVAVPKFVQVSAGDATIVALDSDGGVWKYCAADKDTDRYAFWTKLTGHRADPARR